MKNLIKGIFSICLILSILAACKNKIQIDDQQKQVVSQKSQKDLFGFYKDLELKPGYHFEVLSWGKGVDSIGAYSILMSDSVKKNFKSVSAEREGILTDAWNMDMDNDGNPEIYLQVSVKKNEADLYVYEFAGNSFNKISFRGTSSIKGYNGNDKFFIKEGDLYRTVNVLQKEDGKEQNITKTYRYTLSSNTFSMKENKAEQKN
ncbi:hypothetical protein [Pedobacter montanisoli]|uniref:Lipoprotein n=1 Tax=Pedobacter montanisoli TaxID=2923277 RepID=A0ABS9ZYU1_9SPHI|nr:hypothetical protein [Pedobacter montanisoli]MCJ0743472.1 hypothetical protein [Pedobacter montanisoli]